MPEQVNPVSHTPINNSSKMKIFPPLGFLLIALAILLAWSPWVTGSFAQNKVTMTNPCGNLTVIPQFSAPKSSGKIAFGRTLRQVSTGSCGTYDYFVSALGTVHKIKTYKAEEVNTKNENKENTDSRTYSNSNYNFNLNIPTGFTVQEASDSVTFNSNDFSLKITLSEIPEGDWGIAPPSDAKEIVIDDLTASTYISEDYVTKKESIFAHMVKKYIITFETPIPDQSSKQETIELFERIIKTFKIKIKT